MKIIFKQKQSKRKEVCFVTNYLQMKKTLLLFFACIPLIMSAQLTFDDFDSYTTGAFDSQWGVAQWIGWGGANSNVAISDAYANSGSNSMEIEAEDDIIALLGTLENGVADISFMQYIPSGNGAYFNFQNNYTNSAGSWAAEMFFSDQSAATGRLIAGGAETSFAIVHDTWVENRVEADFNDMLASYYYNGTLVYTWALNTIPDGSAGPNTLNGINFYGFCDGDNCTSLAYYDDVSSAYNPVNIDAPIGYVNALNISPNPTSGQFVLDIELAEAKNLSAEIYNAQGQLVGTQNIGQTQGGQYTMDLSTVSSGLYFVKCLIDEQVLTQQIMVQR